MIAIPVAGILVWLFNSYKLGRLRKWTAMLCGAVVVLAGAAALFLWK